MKRSINVPYIIGLVLAIVVFIFLGLLIWKMLSSFNYKGRLQCKVAYSIASTITSTLSDVELAKLAVSAGMGGYVSYQVASAAKEYIHARYGTIKYYLKELEGYHVTLEKETPSILKVLTENKKVAAIAFLSGILAGTLAYYTISQITNPMENVAKTFVPRVISACRSPPDDIKPPICFADDHGGYKCSEIDTFFKSILLPKYYEELKKELGDCNTNKDKWEAAFNDAYIAYYAMVTYDESLRGANIGVPVNHYQLLLDDPKIPYKYGEGDIVCWWKMTVYSTGKSYYDEIYNKTKKEYIPISPSAYDGDSLCWNVIQKIDHLSKSDLLSNGGDTIDVLSVFADPDFCKKYPTACSGSAYVENYIEWGSANQTYVLVGMALGKVFIVFNYFK